MAHVVTSSNGDAVRPPDGGWGWIVVFASFSIHVIADGFTYTLGIFLVEWMAHFGEGSEGASWIASILVGVTLGSGPVVSCLVNKHGCRAVTIAGGILAAFGLAMSTLAPNVTTLYVTIGLVAGFGFSLMYLPSIVIVTRYFEVKRSFATGIAVCGSGLGTFTFAPLVEFLIVTYSWKGALFILSALTLNCIVFGALFRPLEPSYKVAISIDEESAFEMKKKNATDPVSFFHRDQELGKVTACGDVPCEETFNKMIDWSMLRDSVFVLFTLSNFCTSIGFNVPFVYIKDKALGLNVGSKDASYLIAVIGMANTISRIVLGYISDKTWLNRLWLYNSALIICGIATALSAFCLGYASLVIYCGLFGATIAAFVGLNSVILVDLLGLDKLTNALGLVFLFQGIASLIGPPIIGRLKDMLGSYNPGFYLAGAMISVSGLMLFLIPCFLRPEKKSPSPRTVAVHSDVLFNT